MEALKYLIGIQVLFTALAVIGIIYLLIRKLKKSKEEKFERRDN